MSIPRWLAIEVAGISGGVRPVELLDAGSHYLREERVPFGRGSEVCDLG